MAEVHLARDDYLGRDVALKVLKERLAEDEVFLKRFRREARSAATLNHPNVVQVYDQRRSEAPGIGTGPRPTTEGAREAARRPWRRRAASRADGPPCRV